MSRQIIEDLGPLLGSERRLALGRHVLLHAHHNLRPLLYTMRARIRRQVAAATSLPIGKRPVAVDVRVSAAIVARTTDQPGHEQNTERTAAPDTRRHRFNPLVSHPQSRRHRPPDPCPYPTGPPPRTHRG